MLATCGGFLIAVLWFDLMFDIQVLGHPPRALPEPVLASIAAYYRRAVVDAVPMNGLIALVMLVAVGGSAWQLARRQVAPGRGLAGLLLVSVPTLAALIHIVPAAARLALRTDPIEVQSEIARAICRDHILCLGAIAAFVALQLWPRRTPRP